MNLCSCTIVLKNNHTMTFDNVEQTLGIIDEHGVNNIDNITIATSDGKNTLSYNNLTIEESIESLMSL
ncbi:hypothetical protein [Vibrio hepatarius]|uniref:hypothetical protein n=1 Tax=Vibrio hepatarius TaxID=171383 RepID=UPI00142DDBAA|nr:hypothetical protein [Vibrio hepatarius]NIY84096.1 hypothetical protein [Vibrio hepatarius]NVJ57188.1 hypothetical protein [Vibrionaceae bacterium]